MALTYEPLQAVTLAAATAVTISGIPQTFTDLRILLVGRTSWTTDDYDNIRIRFNGDTGSNYSYTQMGYNLAYRLSNVTGLAMPRFNVSNANTNPSLAKIDILSYSNTNVNKTVLGESSGLKEAYVPTRDVGLWRSTAAITSIELAGGQSGSVLAAGTTVCLFGIRAA